jgi:uncharacterized membrane protein
MKSIKVAHLIYTFGTGLFAGLLYAFVQGVVPMLNALNSTEYAKVEKLLIVSLDAFPTGVIVIATISMLLPLYTLIKLRKHRYTKFWKLTFWGWLLFCFGVSVFTIVFNVPINEYVKTWSLSSPPADWETARQSWHTLNNIRTPINLVSFALFIWAAFSLNDIGTIKKSERWEGNKDSISRPIR